MSLSSLLGIVNQGAKVGQSKYYHDNSIFNQNVIITGNQATNGLSFLLKDTFIFGDTFLAINALEKNPKPPNLFVSGNTFLGKNLTVTNISVFNNLVTMNRNLIVNGKITLAGVGDVALRINRADTLPSSDLKLKENILPIQNALDKVKKLNGVEFDFKNSGDYGYLKKHQIGLIAQEVEKVVPEVVAKNDNGNYGVSYQHLTAILIEAIKEQQEQIEDLKKKLEKINEC